MVRLSDHLQALNPEQRSAVETTDGPVLVLAGAGSGKTRVITTRMAWLLHRGTAANHILAMTFTNKAAGEMRERIAAMVGQQTAAPITVGTFHSFCARLLREFGESIDLPPDFGICDAADQLTAAKAALRDLRIPEAELNPRELLARISLAKNQSPATAGTLQEGPDEEVLTLVRERYDQQLRRSKVLDFDDLLLFSLRLLDRDAALRKRLQKRYRYLMVDEYQDTNGPQYEILKRLAAQHRNLCVVGDDDQSIYGWRGADVSKILNFDRDFPGATVIRLETNYRSTPEILDSANKVIRNNPSRHPKTLQAARDSGEPVRILEFEDELDEADFLAKEIQYKVNNHEWKYSNVAVLFRTATQSRTFETQFRARKIPYRLVGGQSFFDRKEVRDVLAFMRAAENPDDEISLLRIVNTPPRGIGKTTVDKILAYATAHGLSFPQALNRLEQVGPLPAAALRALPQLRQMLAGAAEEAISGEGLVAGIRLLLKEARYRDEVDRCYEDALTRDARWAGVEELLNFAENFCRRKGKKSGFGDFLEELSLATAVDKEPDQAGQENAVCLMTLHAAKGLEFPVVYLAGVEEGFLPHHRSVEENSLEEERRLMYVGITRAMKLLSLCMTQARAKRGRKVRSMASRFYYEMIEEAPPKDWRPVGATESLAPKRPQAKSKRSRPYSRRRR
ncbi:MAG: AAA family ATPase [Planctomycetota bacterium]|nr:MAG: AAA family ATPase [Planctomycetota bacterium]